MSKNNIYTCKIIVIYSLERVIHINIETLIHLKQAYK